LRNKVKEEHDNKTKKQKECEAMRLELGIVNNSKLMNDLKKMKENNVKMTESLQKLENMHGDLDEYLKKSMKLQGLDINQKIANV